MTRKDYVKIASVLAGEMALAQHDGNAGRVWQTKAITYSLADIMAQDNPAFDRQRFYDAVGITS